MSGRLSEELEDVLRYLDAIQRNDKTGSDLRRQLRRAMRRARRHHTLAEIADVAGVSRARIHQLTTQED